MCFCLFRQLSFWICKVILAESEYVGRCRLIATFVRLADALQEAPLQTFHSFMAVMTGLAKAPVSCIDVFFFGLFILQNI